MRQSAAFYTQQGEKIWKSKYFSSATALSQLKNKNTSEISELCHNNSEPIYIKKGYGL